HISSGACEGDKAQDTRHKAQKALRTYARHPSPVTRHRFLNVSARARASTFAPFQIPSFRFQWPADLATSFAFEMENLILGWYVLVETRSVTMLTIYASL